MILEIDSRLKSHGYRYRRAFKDIFSRTIDAERDPATTERFHQSSHGAQESSFSHANYVEYLAQCYAQHYGIVLTPDIIWHTLLSEIASVVKNKPVCYGAIFTTDPSEKTAIIVPSSDGETINLNLIIQALRAFVPNDIDVFLPEFSTTTDLARLARYAAFADLCSPYYSYTICSCGFPAIQIAGSKHDWEILRSGIFKISSMFSNLSDKVVPAYLMEKVYPLIGRMLEAMKNRDGEFFKDILTTEICGSGGEIEINGWWAKYMFVHDQSGNLPNYVPSHISRVLYDHAETKRQFSLNSGLFFSNLSAVDDVQFATPEWGWVRNTIEPVPQLIPVEEKI